MVVKVISLLCYYYIPIIDKYFYSSLVSTTVIKIQVPTLYEIVYIIITYISTNNNQHTSILILLT